jgi:transcriptional regulator with PAS, ATPase and Fis domain
MKSAQDKQEWIKEKKYGEIALKKLTYLSYSPFEEYLLYCRIGYTFFYMSEYSHSLDFYYKAHLVASKNHLSQASVVYPLYEIGSNFLMIKNIKQALAQFLKVEQYYQKYGDNILPMDKQRYIRTIIALGYCYLYKNQLREVQSIIDRKLSSDQLVNSSDFLTYSHLKGEYLIVLKEYEQARQSFQECIKISEQINFPTGTLEAKIHLATIELLEEHLDFAIKMLQSILKNARQLKLNDFICETTLLLSKCYTINNMTNKAISIENRIKPILNKLDIVWLYEKERHFEKLCQHLQSIYRNVHSNSKSVPTVLMNTLNQHHKLLPYKDIIIGQSALMQEVFQLIEKIAPTDLPILIQGETGTGKELVARAIYQNSLRKEMPWLALSCGVIPGPLLENALFGHTKGAFTDAHEDKKGYIELASEGTLFLDEISEMSPAMQQKLLRVLEEKLVWRVGSEKPIPINTRFIFASNQNIEELVQGKLFREDLFYRINTIVITLPPLRDRKEDIPLLVDYFIKKYITKRMTNDPRYQSGLHSVTQFPITNEALSLFVNYPWPGNVRELENEIKRICAVYSESKQITVLMLSESIKNYKISSTLNPLKEARELAEKNVIKEALKKCKGNINKTARLLKYDPGNLYRKVQQFKININNL